MLIPDSLFGGSSNGDKNPVTLDLDGINFHIFGQWDAHGFAVADVELPLM
jgi:hypothetical protein